MSRAIRQGKQNVLAGILFKCIAVADRVAFFNGGSGQIEGSQTNFDKSWVIVIVGGAGVVVEVEARMREGRNSLVPILLRNLPKAPGDVGPVLLRLNRDHHRLHKRPTRDHPKRPRDIIQW